MHYFHLMKIFCVGRNYIDHAKELKNPVPKKPLIFTKPITAILDRNRPFYYPEFSQDIHFEVELVIKMCRHAKHVEEKFAHKYYEEIAVGIDFTARDIQAELKKKGHPWDIAKGFDRSAPISKFIPIESLNNSKDIQFSLKQNGELKQRGQSSEMIFSFDYLIYHLSKYFTLQKGDLIYTGTPAGVGPVQIGDVLECFIEDKEMLKCAIK